MLVLLKQCPGSGDKMSFAYVDMMERIVANSSLESGNCWIWIGNKYPNNSGNMYGRITIRKNKRVKKYYAHRVSLSVSSGIPLQKIKVAMHKCDQTLCVNPYHLISGTQKKNMRDRIVKGR